MGGISFKEQPYENVKRDTIYHFGDIEILTDTFRNTQYFRQKYDFVLAPQIHNGQLELLKKQNNKSPYLIQIKNTQLTESSPCSSSNQITVDFQYLPITLQHLINRGHNFTEHQIIKLLLCLLQAIKFLNSKDSYHGDISPEFIYIDFKNPNQFTFKIFDSAYFQPIRNGYYRGQKQKTYCAPQVLMNLGEKKRLYPIYNHFISDTFSIGLVVLYSMTSVNPLGAYTPKNQIDSYFIQSMFRIAHRKMYSEQLISIIRIDQVRERSCRIMRISQRSIKIFTNKAGKLLQKNQGWKCGTVIDDDFGVQFDQTLESEEQFII